MQNSIYRGIADGLENGFKYVFAYLLIYTTFRLLGVHCKEKVKKYNNLQRKLFPLAVFIGLCSVYGLITSINAGSPSCASQDAFGCMEHNDDEMYVSKNERVMIFSEIFALCFVIGGFGFMFGYDGKSFEDYADKK